MLPIDRGDRALRFGFILVEPQVMIAIIARQLLAVQVAHNGSEAVESIGSTLEFASEQTGGLPNGPFPDFGTKRSFTRIVDAQDGFSHTVSLGEWEIGDGQPDARAVLNVVLSDSY